MKILCQKREQGSVLLAGMIIGLAVGIALASYLALISNRYRMTVRSMDWNYAMPVLESGIEEALTHLHDDGSLTANGWTLTTVAGKKVVSKLRTNSSDGSYFWTIIATNGTLTNPVITSSGFVPVPLGKGYISRTVQVTTSRPLGFANAIAASGLIQLSGSAIVDSYNSCSGPYSTNNSHGSQGSVVTDSKSNPAIKISTGDIYGTVNTGPGGVISCGGAIGDANWISNHTGIETGFSNDTMNVAYPSNSPPANYTNWLAPPTATNVSSITTNTGITSATVLGNNDYTMSSFTSSDSGHPMLVNGQATLYVTGNFTVQGSGYVEILPGGNLTLIVGGSTTTISGSGVVNATAEPSNFTLLGLAGNTTITYSGSAAFQGTINAPQANFTISGSAGGFGAAIVNTFTSTGGSSFHYDACLGAMGSLVINSWQETF
jgi:hypothetical protein